MNATWTHRDDGFVIGLLTGTCVGAGLAIWLTPRLASALRQRVFDLALMSVRRSTNSPGEHKAAEMRLPTRWRVRPTMLRDLPRPSTAVELSQVGRIPMQTAGLRPVAHFRDAVEPSG